MQDESKKLYQTISEKTGLSENDLSGDKVELFKKIAKQRGKTDEEIAPYVKLAQLKQQETSTPDYQVPTGYDPDTFTPLSNSYTGLDGKDASGYRITQRFGNFNPGVEVFSKGFNRGVDVSIPYGTNVKAPKGTWMVKEVFNGANPKGGFVGNRVNNGYGNSVVLYNPQTGEQVRFSHLATTGQLRPGQVVQGGNVVGLVGNSGNSTSTHLDTEYVVGGKLRDFSSKLNEVLGTNTKTNGYGIGGGGISDLKDKLFEAIQNKANEYKDKYIKSPEGEWFPNRVSKLPIEEQNKIWEDFFSSAIVGATSAPGARALPKAKVSQAGLYDQPVYHGSPVPLKKFSNKKGGVFFTSSMENASGFAGNPDNVYEGYLHFKNPLVIDAKGAKWDALKTKYGTTTQEVINNAQKEGYDGVTFKNIVDNVMDTEGVGGTDTIHYAFKPEDAFLNEPPHSVAQQPSTKAGLYDTKDLRGALPDEILPVKKRPGEMARDWFDEKGKKQGTIRYGIKDGKFVIQEIYADQKGTGSGSKIIEKLKDWSDANNIPLSVTGHAESQAIPYWRKMGFEVEGDVNSKSFIHSGKVEYIPGSRNVAQQPLSEVTR